MAFLETIHSERVDATHTAERRVKGIVTHQLLGLIIHRRPARIPPEAPLKCPVLKLNRPYPAALRAHGTLAM